VPRVVASIEARMGSSRLPGKVLADLEGKPALTRLVERLRAARRLDGIVLATTTAPADDALAAWAAREGVACHRGSEEDVLKRVVEAQHAAGGEIAVEITGDCPLVCPDLVDLVIESFFANRCDVASNSGPDFGYPMGTDVQVFPLALLAEVERTIDDPAVREHVSLYFYEHPERYRIVYLVAPPRWHAPRYRLQLDYPEDLRFIREVYRALEPLHGPVFGIEEIMALLRRRPELVDINRHCVEKSAR
jgi:spore coat polysaccharide biosynthesis protein SpsF